MAASPSLPFSAANAASFRTNIVAAMLMGLPNAKELQPIFRWTAAPTYAIADPAGRPYNWTSSPTSSSPAAIPDIQVTCAVQIGGGSSEGTNAGEENEIRAQITLLDTQQAELIANGGRMPDQVILAGATYNVDYVLQEALFVVDVYTIYASAVDQA